MTQIDYLDSKSVNVLLPDNVRVSYTNSKWSRMLLKKQVDTQTYDTIINAWGDTITMEYHERGVLING